MKSHLKIHVEAVVGFSIISHYHDQQTEFTGGHEIVDVFKCPYVFTALYVILVQFLSMLAKKKGKEKVYSSFLV